MNKEINSEENIGLYKLSTKLYELRSIEHSSKSMVTKWKKSQPILRNIYEKLIERLDFLADRPFWNELHDRMVFYYNYLNSESMRNCSSRKIPIFRIVLHNDVVKWWMKCKIKGYIQGPLVHFDTHDDMGLPESEQGLLKDGSIDETGIASGNCGQIFWPVTCMLMSKGIDHVIWAVPKWMYDTNISVNQYLVSGNDGDGFFFVRNTNEKKDKYLLEENFEFLEDDDIDDLREEGAFVQEFLFERIKTHDKKGWDNLAKNIQDKKFILDIDLDFFVTNGAKISNKEYIDIGLDFDIESTGRVHSIPGVFQPREAYADDEGYDTKKKLEKEWKMITKRVDIFLVGLDMLKKKGITPCCINISDSTPSFFGNQPDAGVFTNNYTPKYFVPALHFMLYEGFKDIYGNKVTL